MPIVASRRRGKPRHGLRVPAAAVAAAAAIAIAIAMALRLGSSHKPVREPEMPAAPSGAEEQARIEPASRSVPAEGGARAVAVPPAAAPGKAATPAIAQPPGNVQPDLQAGAKADAPLSPLEKFAREPVKGRAEQLLMLAIPAARGTLVPPLPVDFDGDEELEREAEAMLERDIVVEDYDDEHAIMVKEWFADLRDVWHKAKAEGLTFTEFLRRCQDQADDDTALLDEAMRVDDENYADATLSDEEYLEARRDMDEFLKSEGFEGLPKTEEDEAEEDAGQSTP